MKKLVLAVMADMNLSKKTVKEYIEVAMYMIEDGQDRDTARETETNPQ